MNLRPPTAQRAYDGVDPSEDAVCGFICKNLEFWTELNDEVSNSERESWQTYPEIAFLEE